MFISKIQSFKNILQDLRINRFEPRSFFFKFWKFILLLVISYTDIFFLISFNSFCQVLIIKISAHRKLIFEISNLGFREIYTKFERFSNIFFHLAPCYSTYFFNVSNDTFPADAKKYDGDQKELFPNFFLTAGNSFLINLEINTINRMTTSADIVFHKDNYIKKFIYNQYNPIHPPPSFYSGRGLLGNYVKGISNIVKLYYNNFSFIL